MYQTSPTVYPSHPVILRPRLLVSTSTFIGCVFGIPLSARGSGRHSDFLLMIKIPKCMGFVLAFKMFLLHLFCWLISWQQDDPQSFKGSTEQAQRQPGYPGG